MKNTKPLRTLSAALGVLLLAISRGGAVPSASFRQLVMAMPPPGTPGVPGTAPTKVRRVYVTRTRYRTIYVTPRTANMQLDGKRLALNHPILVSKNTAYVPLREFLAVMETRYGIQFQVDYVGNGQIRVTHLPDAKPHARTFEGLFGQGLNHLWHGRTREAVTAFRGAEKMGGDPEDTQDAAAIADWLSEKAHSGVICFHWWNLPETLRVFVDENEIQRGALIATTRPGAHRLKLVGEDDIVLFDRKIWVTSKEAFVVELAGQVRM